jgi:hypothetical protein
VKTDRDEYDKIANEAHKNLIGSVCKLLLMQWLHPGSLDTCKGQLRMGFGGREAL